MTRIMPGSEPFYFKGNGTGCLLIHGFTGTPNELRWLGTCLASDGLTVLGVRLRGHGTSPEEMNTTRWPDWYASSLEGYRRLRAECERVIVLGLSLGGVLAMHLAAHETVDGLVTMASPLHLRDWRLTVLRPFQPFIPYWRFAGAPAAPGPEPAASVGYDRMPTICLVSMLDFFKLVDRELPRITTPTRLVYSRLDRLAPERETRYICARIGAADKRIIALERSGHVVSDDVERETVLAEVRRFVAGLPAANGQADPMFGMVRPGPLSA